jgi:hypothetical protein
MYETIIDLVSSSEESMEGSTSGTNICRWVRVRCGTTEGVLHVYGALVYWKEGDSWLIADLATFEKHNLPGSSKWREGVKVYVKKAKGETGTASVRHVP